MLSNNINSVSAKSCLLAKNNNYIKNSSTFHDNQPTASHPRLSTVLQVVVAVRLHNNQLSPEPYLFIFIDHLQANKSTRFKLQQMNPFPAMDVYDNFQAIFSPKILPPVKTSRLGGAQPRPVRHLCSDCALPARLQSACYLGCGCSQGTEQSCFVRPTVSDVAGGREESGKRAGSMQDMRRRRAGGAKANLWCILTHFPQIYISLYVNEVRR